MTRRARISGGMPVRRGIPRCAPALGLALALCACSTPPPPTFEVAIAVHGDPGQPLASARVLFNGKQVGKTDATGAAVLRLHGTEGQTFAFNVSCPEGFHSPDKPIFVTLRRIAEPSKRPEYVVECPPTTRKVVVAVRAENGPDLPVVYLGQVIGKTDAWGAAHLLMKVPPGQSFKLSLDTSGAKQLRPENPAMSFEVKDQDELFVFDQSFKVEHHRVYHRARPHGPTPL